MERSKLTKVNRARTAALVGVAAVLTLTLSCGGENNEGATDAGGDSTSTGAQTPIIGGSTATGTLSIDGESIEVASVGCSIDEPPSSEIDATAVLSGTNAAGLNISLTFTRFNDTSLFAGDSVRILFGDRGTGREFITTLEGGGVSIDGSTVSATDVTLEAFGPTETASATFELNC